MQGGAAASNYGSIALSTVRPLLVAQSGAGATASLWLTKMPKLCQALLSAHLAGGLSVLAVQHCAWLLAPPCAACHLQQTGSAGSRGQSLERGVVLTMPPDAQLGWERGQLDTLLNPNRSMNGAPPVAACIARFRGLGACATLYVSPCLCAPLLLAARASCLLP